MKKEKKQQFREHVRQVIKSLSIDSDFTIKDGQLADIAVSAVLTAGRVIQSAYGITDVPYEDGKPEEKNWDIGFISNEKTVEAMQILYDSARGDIKRLEAEVDLYKSRNENQYKNAQELRDEIEHWKQEASKNKVQKESIASLHEKMKGVGDLIGWTDEMVTKLEPIMGKIQMVPGMAAVMVKGVGPLLNSVSTALEASTWYTCRSVLIEAMGDFKKLNHIK